MRGVALALLAAGLLTACETTSSGPSPSGAPPAQFVRAGEPAKPEPPKAEADKPAVPMTRARAAADCWMKIEKGSASVSIDKRADIVTKCIDDTMKAAKTPPKT